jgi:hypothetical protein
MIRIFGGPYVEKNRLFRGEVRRMFRPASFGIFGPFLRRK